MGIIYEVLGYVCTFCLIHQSQGEGEGGEGVPEYRPNLLTAYIIIPTPYLQAGDALLP